VKAFSISKFLFVVFNEIISHQKIAKRLKIPEIIAIPKPGKNKSKFESYTSIALQNNIYKMLDTFV
jgi:hypothetical protein